MQEPHDWSPGAAREQGWDQSSLQHASSIPSPESLLSFQTHFLPTEVQIPNPHSNPLSLGGGWSPLSSCVSTLLPHFPGRKEPGTWTKLLSNMGSGRRGRYSPFWRVFCSSPRMGTHFWGSWGGWVRRMFNSRFMTAVRTAGGSV